MSRTTANDHHASQLLDFVEGLQRIPTAPFREEWVCAYVDQVLSGIPGVRFMADRFGNRIVRLTRGKPTGTAVTFIAHLDHPGFLFLDGTAGPGFRHQATFEGRVFDRFFEGAAVRLYRSADDPGIRGRIVSASPDNEHRDVLIETEEDAEGAVLGMWDLPPFALRDGIIDGRACDDLAGCAALLETLRRLGQGSGDVDVCVVFSRAEESGFCGLLCMLEEKPLPHLIPADTVFVSVEISSQTPTVAVGEGAIIRVGDRSSTFDGRIVDLLWGLTKRNPQCRARRALMDRGTCEATPTARAGFRAGGICAPVGHYHNMNQDTGRITTEQVALGDLESLVELAAGLALASSRGEEPEQVVTQNYDLYLQKGHERLTALPLTVPAAG